MITVRCEFPGVRTTGPVQLRILHKKVMDMRGGGVHKVIDDGHGGKEVVRNGAPVCEYVDNSDAEDEEARKRWTDCYLIAT